MASVTDIQRVRKKKKAMKIFKRIIVVIVLCAIAILSVVYKEQVSDLFSVFEQSEFTRSSNGFPQNLNGTKIDKVFTHNEDLFILTDMAVSVYSHNAKKVTQIQHSFANPDICVNGNYFIVFARGSNKLTLYTKEKQIFEITTEHPIVQASVSKTGKVAIATASEVYNTSLIVYSKQKTEVLKWNSTEQVTAIEFSENDKNIAIATANTKSGLIYGNVYKMNFHKEEPDFKQSFEDTLILELQETEFNNMIVVGDSKSILIDSTGAVKNEIEYNSELTGFKLNANITALVIQNVNNINCNEVLLLDKQLAQVGKLTIDNKVQSVNLCGEKIIIVTDRKVFVYNKSGEIEKEIESNGAFVDVVWLQEKYISVDLDKIDIIN